jgi:hypothetical protein
MIASQFTLDHRLAELRQIGTDLRATQAARAASTESPSIAAVIRSLLGWAPFTRPAGLAAR